MMMIMMVMMISRMVLIPTNIQTQLAHGCSGGSRLINTIGDRDMCDESDVWYWLSIRYGDFIEDNMTIKPKVIIMMIMTIMAIDHHNNL
jgi:hypothetical protein